MQQELSPKSQPVQFEGKGNEYFKIWLVNIALTILTLGIYSAWAKVRNKRYFYGSTKIQDQAFEYHATGKQIFLSRMIAVVVFIAYNIIGSVSVILAILLPLCFLGFLPWLLNAGLRFNARMSSWRNVRFNFNGSYGRAVMVFCVWPFIALITFGILLPKAIYKAAEYIVSAHSYGDEPFKFTAIPKDYARVIYGFIIVLIVLVLFVLLCISSVNGDGSDYAAMVLPALIGAIYIFYFFAGVLIRAMLFNIYWRHVELKGNRFTASLNPARFLWVFISNSIMVGLSLGLLIPWSKVRMARLKANALTVIEVNSFARIQAEQQEKISALGEEMGEVFDVDVGFGV